MKNKPFCAKTGVVAARYSGSNLEWQTHFRAAWEYQYTKVKAPPTRALAETIHQFFGGSPRGALVLFRFTQQVAINEDGDKIITPELIERAASLNINSLQPIN